MSSSTAATTETGPAWHIQLLGGLRLQGLRVQGARVQGAPPMLDEESPTHFRSHQTGALLAFLAFHRGRAFGRGALIEMLWPDCDEKAGRNRLSVALSSLRTQLQTDQESIFLAEGDNVTLRASAVTTDVAAFENALRQAAKSQAAQEEENVRLYLAQALSLYGGRLLAGYDEAWIGPQARRLEEEFFRAARRLIVLHRERGERGRALGVAQRAVAIDPTREELQRDLIRLLVQTGQLEAARRHGIEFERILREQAGLAPDATTRALLREIESHAQRVVRTAQNGAGTVINRPVLLTRFFGREADLETLRAWLQQKPTRLLTLTGTGGSGKTRLAIEAARACEEPEAAVTTNFSGGAWFVPLAELSDAALLPETLRGALHLPPAPGVGALEQLIEVLSSGPSLLILDNFEQLLPHGAPLLQNLLERLPQLQMLVTSRRKLNLPGEREHIVAPLPLPDETQHDPAHFAAALLFEDRARAARPDFVLQASNARDVGVLCRRLDGIPLAIELAAARCNVLTPAQIAAHLNEKLDLLTASHASTPQRHRTLRAAIEWSFRLLPPELQSFWTRLSVFRGGCTWEAAQEVCGEKGALDALSQLRDHSLLRAEERNGVMRFEMLETLREFADEALSLDQRAQAQRSHLSFFARLAVDSEPALQEAQQAQWLARLDAEAGNLNLALSWALQNDPETALHMSVKLSSYWECRGLFAQGARQLQTALQSQTFQAGNEPEVGGPEVEHQAVEVMPSGLAATPDFWQGRALCEAGRLACFAGDYAQARALLEKGIAIFRARQDDVALAWSFNSLGVVLSRQGEGRAARVLHDEALTIARAHGYRELEVDCLSGLANLAVGSGDAELLRAVVPAKLSLQRELGNERGVAFALLDAAMLALLDGDLSGGCRLCEDSLSIFRALGEPWGMSRALIGLGIMRRRQGEIAVADQTCREALQILLQTGNAWELVALLEQFAYLALSRQKLQTAALLLGAVQNARRIHDAPRPAPLKAEYAQQRAALKRRLTPPTFEKLWLEGQALNLEQALALVQIDDSAHVDSRSADSALLP